MNAKQWAAIIAGICGIAGAEIVKITGWREMLTPTFVGALLVQIAGLVAAVWGAYRAQPYANEGGVDVRRFQ